MFKYSLIPLLIFSPLAVGQAQTASRPAARPQAQRPAARPQPQRPKLPDFSANPDVAKFIAHMAAAHKFDDKELAEQFTKISPNQRVLTLFRPPQTPQAARPEERSWASYRARFINKSRIDGGVAFWLENKETLDRAYEQYGVPPEAIVAIIGVETLYGRQTGGFVVMEALASLAFHDPGRGDFFRSELEHFLLLSRENGFDFLRPQGSYAGAIGIPQFMPGSWRKYAVDFDGDGVIDLERNVNDAIGSVANYLKEHGWERDEAIVHKTKVVGSPKAAWLEAGMLPSLKVEELAKNGVQVDPNLPTIATFISLPTPQQQTEYWLGFKNYYAITRYNRSTFYAMSVVQLAEELKTKFFTASK
jgi:membrane-bound lytic murein transglycosylase B